MKTRYALTLLAGAVIFIGLLEDPAHSATLDDLANAQATGTLAAVAVNCAGYIDWTDKGLASFKAVSAGVKAEANTDGDQHVEMRRAIKQANEVFQEVGPLAFCKAVLNSSDGAFVAK